MRSPQELKELEAYPEMANHLAYILVHCPPELLPIRGTAGGALTGLLGRKAHQYEPASLAPLKGLILAGVSSPDADVRKFSCNCGCRLVRVLSRRETTFAAGLGPGEALPADQRAWPELLGSLEAGFASGNPHAAAGCALFASQLVEDLTGWISSQGEGHLSNVLTRLYQVAAADPAGSMGFAVAAVRPVMLLSPEDMPPAIVSRPEQWIDLLLAALASSPDPAVRRKAVDGLSQMVDALPQHVGSRMEAAADRVMTACSDPDPTVSASAIEFWSFFVEWVTSLAEAVADGPGRPARPDRLKSAHESITVPLLPRLVPILVRSLKILPQDAARVPIEEDGGPAAAAAARAAAGPAAASTAEWAADGDDLVALGMYTPRSSARFALDTLSRSTGAHLASTVWPMVTGFLGQTAPDRWQEVEAGLTILDCTVRGSYDWYKDKLGVAVPHILELASASTRPVIRSSACGVVQRIAGIVAKMDDAGVTAAMGKLALCMADGVGAVQARATQALRDILVELNDEGRLRPEWAAGACLKAAELMPVLSDLGRQQACTLFAAASDMLHPTDMAPVISPVVTRLLEWWGTRPEGGTSDSDSHTRAVLEALNSLIVSSGAACAPFARVIIPRCTKIIQNAQIQKEAAAAAGEGFGGSVCTDFAFEVVGNCIGSASSEADAKAFLASSDFLHTIGWFITNDDDCDVLESAIGALAECLQRCPAETVPTLVALWPGLVCNIHADYRTACTQALWLAAESLRLVPEALGAKNVETLAVRVRAVLVGEHDRSGAGSTMLGRIAMANLAVVTARLMAVNPAMVLPWLGQAPAFVNLVSSATMTDDASEKLESALAIGRAMTEVPAIVRSREVVRVVSALVSSFATVEMPGASAAEARTVAAGLMRTMRAQLSDTEWLTESAAVGRILRRRVNDVTGVVVFPLGK